MKRKSFLEDGRRVVPTLILWIAGGPPCLIFTHTHHNDPAFGGFVAIYLLGVLYLASKHDAILTGRRSEGPRWCIRFLQGYKWFCSDENRDIIQLVIADLKRDSREMEREGRSELFINAALGWKTQSSVIGILLNALLQLLGAVLPIGKLVRDVKSWL